MEKTQRAELIAALVTDKYSGFTDGDEPILEAASDSRLEDFRTCSEKRRAEANTTAKMETDNRNVTARLKVAEDRLKSSEQSLSEDEFLSKAPESIKALVEDHRAREAAEAASIISQLKDLGAIPEDELKKKPLSELRTLATYARVDVPDFSGRGLPRSDRNQNSTKTYAPPDPYAAGLKALREKAH